MVSSIDADKDEALRLVGLERAGSYSEEQYQKVKRKLVRDSIFSEIQHLLLACIGSCHCAFMYGIVWFPIPVGKPSAIY